MVFERKLLQPRQRANVTSLDLERPKTAAASCYEHSSLFCLATEIDCTEWPCKTPILLESCHTDDQVGVADYLLPDRLVFNRYEEKTPVSYRDTFCETACLAL